MAGNYPDVPARRIAWDRDGSIGAVYNSGFTSFTGQMTQTQMNELADDSTGIVNGNPNMTTNNDNKGLAILFPTVRTIRALLAGTGDNSSGSISYGSLVYSLNTTNGIDGTWAGFSAGVIVPNCSTLGIRTAITSVTPVANVKAIRWGYSAGSTGVMTPSIIHIYGDEPASDRLAIWHPTLDQEHAGPYFDWGDVPRGTQHDRTFRVKNLHSLTANGVVVTREALTLTSPSQVTQHTLSDGGAFASSINIGNLAPGAISGVLTVRNTVDPAAALSLAWLRLVATAASFS